MSYSSFREYITQHAKVAEEEYYAMLLGRQNRPAVYIYDNFDRKKVRKF